MTKIERVIALCKLAYPKHNYEGHLIPVVENSMRLCEKYGADPSIVEPGAYLHDIGRVTVRIKHDLTGYWIGKTILPIIGYSKEETKRISNTILRHSVGSYPPKTIEDKCVTAGDAAAHITNWDYLLAIRYRNNGNNINEAREWTAKKITSSFERKLIILDGTQELYHDRYKAALEVLTK